VGCAPCENELTHSFGSSSLIGGVGAVVVDVVVAVDDDVGFSVVLRRVEVVRRLAEVVEVVEVVVRRPAVVVMQANMNTDAKQHMRCCNASSTTNKDT